MTVKYVHVLSLLGGHKSSTELQFYCVTVASVYVRVISVFLYCHLGFSVVLGYSYAWFCQYQSSDWLRRLGISRQGIGWEDYFSNGL